MLNPAEDATGSLMTFISDIIKRNSEGGGAICEAKVIDCCRRLLDASGLGCDTAQAEALQYLQECGQQDGPMVSSG